MAKLVKFEVVDGCPLEQSQIDTIKESIEYDINMINHVQPKGFIDKDSLFISSYINEIKGKTEVASIAGILIDVQLED